MLRTAQGGFTLVELMITVIVIGILTAIAIPNFIRLQEKAREASVKTNMHTFHLVAEDYSVLSDGAYATAASAAAALLPSDFQNPFTGSTGQGNAWMEGTANSQGLVGYEGTANGYMITGYGVSAPLSLTLTSGN